MTSAVDPGLHAWLVSAIAAHICARDESDDPVDWGSTDSVASAAADAVGPLYEETRAAGVAMALHARDLRRALERIRNHAYPGSLTHSIASSALVTEPPLNASTAPSTEGAP